MSAPCKAALDGFAKQAAEAATVIVLFRRAMQRRFSGDADLWMRSNLPTLGGRHPEHVCSEAGGMERCLAALANSTLLKAAKS